VLRSVTESARRQNRSCRPTYRRWRAGVGVVPGGAGRYSTRGRTIDKGGAGDTVIGGSGILAGAMRGGIWSRLGAGAAVLALTSCGSASGDPGALPVPTFPATPPAAAAGGGGGRGPGR